MPNGPGIDTFTYRVVDSSGAASNAATVTIYVTGPAGPPIVGNDLFEVQQGRELAVAAPGVLTNDTSPNPRLGLTVLLQRDTAKGTLLLQPDGSFVYTPLPGFTGIDQFSYRCATPRAACPPEAHVGITVTGRRSADGDDRRHVTRRDGATILGPTHVHRDPRRRQPARPSPSGPCRTADRAARRSCRWPPAPAPVVAADFDPTLVRNGTYSIVIRAVTSGGGVLVSETGVSVEGDYKPGRYTTTFRDVALNSSNIPIELLRTYDSTNKASGELGAGWSLELANFRVESNGPLGGGGWSRFTCGTFPFLATCYESSQAALRHRHVARRARRALPLRPRPRARSWCRTLTTAGFVAEPGTTSTLEPVGNGLLLSGVGLPARRLLQRRRHLRPDPVRAHRQVRHPATASTGAPACSGSPTATATPSASAATASARRRGSR